MRRGLVKNKERRDDCLGFVRVRPTVCMSLTFHLALSNSLHLFDPVTMSGSFPSFVSFRSAV